MGQGARLIFRRVILSTPRAHSIESCHQRRLTLDETETRKKGKTRSIKSGNPFVEKKLRNLR